MHSSQFALAIIATLGGALACGSADNDIFGSGGNANSGGAGSGGVGGSGGSNSGGASTGGSSSGGSNTGGIDAGGRGSVCARSVGQSACGISCGTWGANCKDDGGGNLACTCLGGSNAGKAFTLTKTNCGGSAWAAKMEAFCK